MHVIISMFTKPDGLTYTINVYVGTYNVDQSQQ